MDRPRFTVGAVHSGATQAVRAGDAFWYVHDSAYGYAIVKQFGGSGTDPEKAARALAARLNDEETNHD